MEEGTIANTCPDLLKEWAYIDNLLVMNPKKAKVSEEKNVFWQCRKCMRKYYMSPKLRVRYYRLGKTACPVCGHREQKK